MVQLELKDITSTDYIGAGSECTVYSTKDKNVILKIYRAAGYNEVADIIIRNERFERRGLAPAVYSDVVELDGRYGYFTERVTPVEELNDNYDYDIQIEICNQLADALNIPVGSRNELGHNWGLTRDKRPVLIDFGDITFDKLGLLDR